MARTTSSTRDPRVTSILDQLRALGSEVNRAGMARYGINVQNAFGVPLWIGSF